jgi:tetratricopeptide (TPR) repeat protein
MSELSASFWKRLFPFAACFILLSVCLCVSGQTGDPFGDDATDPVRLFERGQSAHARGELKKRSDLRTGAQGAAGVSGSRVPARQCTRVARTSAGSGSSVSLAISYKKNWSLPYSALGVVLMRQSRDKEARTVFRQALTIDNKEHRVAMLSRLRCARAIQAALDLAKRATANPKRPLQHGLVSRIAEKANGNKRRQSALDHVLAKEPENVAALMERADLFTDEKNFELAIAISKRAKLKPDDKA